MLTLHQDFMFGHIHLRGHGCSLPFPRGSRYLLIQELGPKSY